MYKNLIAIFACVLLIGSVPAIAGPAIGDAAPDFEAVDINGDSIKLSDFKGKAVVLEWTSSVCPCVARHYKTGNMQKLQKKTIADGVIWLTIVSAAPGNPGNITAEEAKAVIEQHGASPTTKILDESGEIGKAFGAKTTPHMFVISAEGMLVYSGAIDSDSSYEADPAEAKNYVLAALENLAAGEPVATPETQPYGCGIKY